MIWVFDLDGTICNTEFIGSRWEYNKCTPREDIIHKINQLYDMGHYIIIFTARGSTSKIDAPIIFIASFLSIVLLNASV